MRNPHSILRLLVAAWVVLPLVVRADTTGQLRGTVTDGQGAPLAGVSVSASSPAQIGGEQRTQTDERGEFRYPLLAPGDYLVRLTLDGYVTQELTEVRVRLERTTQLQVTMAEATFEDEIVVVETTPVVDPEQTSAGQIFTTEYLEKASIGMDGRSYLAVPPQAAGVSRVTSFGGEPSFRIHGSRDWENSFLIDGVETAATWAFGVTFTGIGFDAIQEVAVHTAGFGAEHGLATGGVINVVTKSGGNRFQGSVDLRYRDTDFEESGEFYDPDEEPSERRALNASFGGPLLRDRLWFFLSGSDGIGSHTPVNTPYSIDSSVRLVMGKLTWQASPGWSLAGRYLAENIDEDRAFGNQFRSEEATSLFEYEPRSSSLELTGILSPSLVWRVQLGDLDAPVVNIPFDRDFTTIGHLNFVTGERYGNAASQFYNDWGRQEAKTDLSWFVPAARGSHEIQAGLRCAELDFGRSRCFNGSGRACTVGDEGFIFWDGVDEVTGANRPDEMDVRIAAGRRGVTGSQASVFISDAWRLRPDLTLHLGLRWDESQQQHDFGAREVELGALQPRLGVAWDVRGNGRNLVRASWGRFMHPSALALGDFFLADRLIPIEIWLSCSTYIGPDNSVCQDFAEETGVSYRTDPESWDPAGWWLWGVFSAEPDVVAPDLEPMVVDHLVLAFERELFRRTSLELSFIQKDFGNIIEDTCIGNYPEPSADADCSSFILANLAQAQRDYQAWTLRFESRALDRLHAIASWVYADAKGNVDGFVIGWDLDKFPELYENRYGYLADHGHRIKINGFVELPWDLLLGFAGGWSSEQRWTPTRPFRGFGGSIFLEPRGNRKEDGLYNLDLQLSKGIQIGRTRLQLIGTVYNALDTEQPTTFCTNVSGCGGFDLGDPIDWQRPRSYEVGVRIDF